jgi:hypothetical protein
MPAGVTLVLHSGENPTVVTATIAGGGADDAAEAPAAGAAEAKPAGGDAKPAA